MDFRADSRLARVPELRIGAYAYEQRIAAAATALAEVAPDDVDTRALKQIELDIIHAERDLFFLEHDTTGARKGEVFGRDIRTLIQRCGLRYDENGAVSFADPAAQNMHVLQVNMGELDRLNAVGDHSLGDRGLDATFQHIQATVRLALIEANPAKYHSNEDALIGAYDIYRTSGNDFSVIIRDMDAQRISVLHQKLSKSVDIPLEHPEQDPIPLSVSHAAFEDAAQMLRMLEPSPSAEVREESETIFVSLLKEKLQTFNDFEKIRTRGERMVRKIVQDTHSGGMGPSQLYDVFLKKYIGNLFLNVGETGPLSFEQFHSRVQELGAFDEHPTAWRGRLFTVARDEALKQFIARNTSERATSEHILQYVLRMFEEQASDEAISVPNRFVVNAAESLKLQDRAVDANAIEAFQTRAAILGQTDGYVKLAALLQQCSEEVSADTRKHTGEHRRLLQLQYDVECAKRDKTTGLYGRSEYVHTLEAALSADTPVTVVAIDMAFLKFFDKEGGSKTGDEAIVTAGRILDYVARDMRKKHQMMIETYRVGGDEFALILGTTDKAVIRETLGAVNIMTDRIGQIPLFDASAKAYQPEALQFNFGTSSTASREDMRTQLTELGITLSSEEGGEAEVRECSDFLIRIADQAVESDKAVNRFMFLLSREIENQRLATDLDSAARQAEVEALMLYSEKAIFGEVGRQKLAEWKSAIFAQQKTIAQIVTEELVPFVATQLRSKGKETAQFETGLLQRLELALQVRFAELRIVELERELERMETALGTEHDALGRLRQELVDVRADRDRIDGLRGRIGGS